MPTGVRCAQTAFLDESADKLRFVSGARASALARMGIRTVRDLLQSYPHRYLDMTQVSSIASSKIGDTPTIVGRIGEVKVKKPRPRMVIVEASLVDDTGVLFGTWFGQPWIADKIKVGDYVAFSGKVEFNFGFKRMNSPFIDVISSASDEDRPSGASDTHTRESLGRIIAMHPLSEGLSSAWMRRIISEALSKTDSVLDPLPPDLRIKRGLISKHAALRGIHFPSSTTERDDARNRLAYEEILRVQLFLMMRRNESIAGLKPRVHIITGSHITRLYEALPFELTGEQKSAIEDILTDMATPRIMNRLLLGDVGTGKTVVAACAIAAAADTHTQACMMAPTSVLAQQYVGKLGSLFDQAKIPWAILTGATAPSERARILRDLAEGSITVLFGTHAVLQDDVVFSDLSLVIIDEQHRFGVEQRAALRAKGPGSDLLLMTATPIPRSLALMLYGDLDCSYIRTRPFSMSKTTTRLVKKSNRAVAYEAIRKAVSEGRQAYIVCPLVGLKIPKQEDDGFGLELEESIENHVDVADVKAARQEARYLATKVFPEARVGLLTGPMSPKDKSEMMDRFRKGSIDILVSTTVIEVGVDVPNATVMMVEDAERFGLSQLHQLRGRISRGEHSGELYLIASPGSDESKQRLSALAKTDDGFELAEYDLRLRREGDILGSRQHGIPPLHLIHVIRDAKLIRDAHEDASLLLAVDPLLEHTENGPLAKEMERVFARTGDVGGSA